MSSPACKPRAGSRAGGGRLTKTCSPPPGRDGFPHKVRLQWECMTFGSTHAACPPLHFLQSCLRLPFRFVFFPPRVTDRTGIRKPAPTQRCEPQKRPPIRLDLADGESRRATQTRCGVLDVGTGSQRGETARKQKGGRAGRNVSSVQLIKEVALVAFWCVIQRGGNNKVSYCEG